MKSLNKIVLTLGMAGMLAVTGAQANNIESIEAQQGNAVNLEQHQNNASYSFEAEQGMTVNLHLPLGSKNYFLGNHEVEMGSDHSFPAYSIDPNQMISDSKQPYTNSVLGLDNFLTDASTRLSNVTELYRYAYADSREDKVKAAGFQLALWEVFNDNNNLDTGIVMKTDSTRSSVLGEAQTLLDHLANHHWAGPAGDYLLTAYTNPGYQDFVIATAVPEPETWALIMAGLGLVGWRTRIRKQG
jgi:hypothetical protein